MRSKVQEVIDQKYQLLPDNIQDVYNKFLVLQTKNYEYDSLSLDYIQRVTLENQEIRQELEDTYKGFNQL